METNGLGFQGYSVLETLGKGGFSQVYKAKNLKNGDIVALKKYRTHDCYNRKKLMEDVERELNVLKNATHPSIVKVHDFVCREDDVFLVMEYVEGKSLQDICDLGRGLRKKEVFSVARQILSAMYYLHSLEPPIVYRDLKPANVIMQDDGTIKLIDFGNAKRYNRDVFADDYTYGTPKFAAPEQFGTCDGRGIYNTDIRTDIYGIGALLYFLASRIKLGEKGSIYRKTIYWLKYGKRFNRVISRATMLNPKDRYANDIEMLLDISRCR